LARPPHKERGRCKSITAVGRDQASGQPIVFFKEPAHVRAVLQFIKEVEQGLWSESMESFGQPLQS
jgi:hypothetical protein